MIPYQPRHPRRAMAPTPGLSEQLTRLVYELLDAHDDTARIGTGQNFDARWQAHLSYLRDLQRVARELLARAGQQPFVTPSADQPERTCVRARGNARGTRDQSSAFGGTRRQYVDDMIDDYVSWRDACAAVAVSYEDWRCSDRPDRKVAFSVYVAALDREQQAAAAYQRAVARVAMA